MNSVNDYIGEIKSIDDQLRFLKHKRKQIINDFINKFHPLQIGDKTLSTENNYKDSEMAVISRSVSFSIANQGWTAMGNITRTDNKRDSILGFWYQPIEEAKG